MIFMSERLSPSPQRLAELAAETWDILIVGAGPAGSVLAIILARRGWRVLLAEKSTWPREKVCGGCLNAEALRYLRQLGIAPPESISVPTNRCLITRGGRSVAVQLSPGIAVSRRDLDHHLVRRATNAGATFVSQAMATLLPSTGAESRSVTLQSPAELVTLTARVVVACDGIQGGFLRREPWARWQIDHDSWMGLAATYESNERSPEPGTIAMHLGDDGYVGVVRLADGATHLAAALSSASIRYAGSPAAAVERIFPAGGSGTLKYNGTGLLTRQRGALGSHRVLVAGDACGYVEPFSGQGMAWAIRSAIHVADLLPQPHLPWPDELPARYQDLYARTILPAQRACRSLRYGLHRPALAAAAMTLAHHYPSLGTWAAQRLL